MTFMSSSQSVDPIAVVSRAACRVDFAGGTVDLWPLYLFHPGAVTVNVAVDVQTTCRITPNSGKKIVLRSTDTGRTDEFQSLSALDEAKKYQHPLAAHLVKWFRPQCGFTMETHSESPAGAGISGSSALMIASTAALARFTGRELDREEIRVIAQNIEAQLIRVPTGCQDYYPALYGGVSAIHLDVDGIHRTGIDVDPGELERRFVLVYTGAPRQSGINNWEVFKAHIDGSRKVHRNFDRITEIARAMEEALGKAAWDDVARLLREEWKMRRTNAPGIATPFIDDLIAASRKHGAVAAKVCGAGGGGCVVFMVKPGARERVEASLASMGGTILPFRVERNGVQVEVAKLASRSR
jgi:D-glycero-alpha-D-manno-heptose-7-phosphate kinase